MDGPTQVIVKSVKKNYVRKYFRTADGCIQSFFTQVPAFTSGPVIHRIGIVGLLWDLPAVWSLLHPHAPNPTIPPAWDRDRRHVCYCPEHVKYWTGLGEGVSFISNKPNLMSWWIAKIPTSCDEI